MFWTTSQTFRISYFFLLEDRTAQWKRNKEYKVIQKQLEKSPEEHAIGVLLNVSTPWQ